MSNKQDEAKAQAEAEAAPTEQQDAHESEELAVAQFDAEGAPLKGHLAAQLEEIKNDLDSALAHFENTSDNHDHTAALETIDGIRDRLTGLRTRVADLMREAAE
jgi:hypothetical protein